MQPKPKSLRKDLRCPFFQRSLDKVCHTCALYVGITQAGGDTQWDCSFALTPLYQIQMGKLFHDGMNGLQKASEEARNATVLAAEATMRASDRNVRLLAAVPIHGVKNGGAIHAIEDQSDES